MVEDVAEDAAHLRVSGGGAGSAAHYGPFASARGHPWDIPAVLAIHTEGRALADEAEPYTLCARDAWEGWRYQRWVLRSLPSRIFILIVVICDILGQKAIILRLFASVDFFWSVFDVHVFVAGLDQQLMRTVI
jgi:hypothetical protein